MANEEAVRSALRSLLDRTQLPDAELDDRFAQAVSPSYWRELCPQLSVDGGAGDDWPEIPVRDEELGHLAGHVASEGYFQTAAAVVPEEVAARMTRGVLALRAAGWSPFFGYVYDEFWQVLRTRSLQRLVTRILGEGYRQVTHVVTHCVWPATGAGAEAGWRPHVDFSDRSDRLTVWIALTEATLDNGCIYVIPRSRVKGPLLEKFMQMSPIDHSELKTLLHASRALPAVAGSVLGWRHDLIHWGSQATSAATPRISLSVVFLAKHGAPEDADFPLLEASDLPTFEQRLYAVGRGIQYYRMNHPVLLGRYVPLGKRLTDALGHVRGQE